MIAKIFAVVGMTGMVIAIAVAALLYRDLTYRQHETQVFCESLRAEWPQSPQSVHVRFGGIPAESVTMLPNKDCKGPKDIAYSGFGVVASTGTATVTVPHGAKVVLYTGPVTPQWLYVDGEVSGSHFWMEYPTNNY